jgi:hypothetical protein
MDITRKGDHITIDINEDRKMVIELYRINFGGDHAFVVRLPNGEHEIFNTLRDALTRVARNLAFNNPDERDAVIGRFLRYFVN